MQPLTVGVEVCGRILRLETSEGAGNGVIDAHHASGTSVGCGVAFCPLTSSVVAGN